MGCRCNERRAAIKLAASSALRGDVRAATQSLSFATRTLVQDTRSGALQREAVRRLSQMRAARR